MKGNKQFREIRKFKVLLADDDPEDRILFKEAFGQLAMGIEIFTVKNGREALDFLNASEFFPEIMFLDLNMPVMGGMACLREIRKQEKYKDMCICIYSSSSNEDEIEESFVLGANIYIKKPSDFEEMKLILKKAVTSNSHCTEPYVKREFFILSLGNH